MTKFSVLIPTRNRLSYLKMAVESVIQQDYDQWEIIISDNYSEEDIESYVKELNDDRIKFYRTKEFIPVTDNWNHALEKSVGDYVIMLGDDDALMKGYFREVLKLLNQFDSPDLLYTSAFLYAYPGVFSDFPLGLVHQWGNAEFLEGKKEPYILDKSYVVEMVKRSLNFNVLFNFNMQFVLVARGLIKELQNYGKFYQSPYPDYYATTTLMLKAKKILAVPHPLVIVGITPKSFGYFYFNQKEQAGIDFLKNVPDESLFKEIKKYLMPGSQMHTTWLLSLETVKKNLKEEYDLKVNYNKYRFLQVLHHFKNYASEHEKGLQNFWKMTKSLSWWEKIIYLPPFLILSPFFRLYPQKKHRNNYLNDLSTSFSHPRFTMRKIDKNFNDILEITQEIDCML
jgi:glycosyltransferase involved in cell wall biosynthesis